MSKCLGWIPTPANRIEAQAYVDWANANSPFAPALFTEIEEFAPCGAYPDGLLRCAFLGPDLKYDHGAGFALVAEPEDGPSLRPNAMAPDDYPPPEE